LEIISKLGEGSFGAVYLGKFRKRHVAIKKLAGSMLSSQVNDFFREASLMLSIPPHRNVVRIFGMCQEMNNFSLVMEFLPSGSLDGFIASLDRSYRVSSLHFDNLNAYILRLQRLRKSNQECYTASYEVLRGEWSI
jgi:serine/threonine protein kinase